MAAKKQWRQQSERSDYQKGNMVVVQQYRVQTLYKPLQSVDTVRLFTHPEYLDLDTSRSVHYMDEICKFMFHFCSCLEKKHLHDGPNPILD